jgi:hypothetical protein
MAGSARQASAALPLYGRIAPNACHATVLRRSEVIHWYSTQAATIFLRLPKRHVTNPLYAFRLFRAAGLRPALQDEYRWCVLINFGCAGCHPKLPYERQAAKSASFVYPAHFGSLLGNLYC